MAETSSHDSAHSSDYKMGSMPIERQSDTFGGFMSISRYSGAAIVLIVFWSTIFFGMHGGTWATAFSTIGLGLLLAAGLKLRGAYIPIMVLSCLVLGVLGIWLAGWRDSGVVETAQLIHTFVA